jgi:integrase
MTIRGHLKQRSAGSWSIILELGRDPETGKRRQSWVTFHGTKRKALDELDRLKAEALHGGFVEPHRLTVSDYLDRWSAEYAEARVSGKTLERYRSIVKEHLKPAFGSLLLMKLSPLDIQRHYTNAMKAGGRKDGRPGGLSPRTVLHHHRLIHGALKMAVRWRLIPVNPADGVEPPKVRRREVIAIDETQSAWLMDAAIGTRLHVPIVLAIAAGLRRGEILALRWADWEPTTGRLWIRRSVEETQDGIRFKETKSDRVRAETLPQFAIEVLESHRASQDERRRLLADEYRAGDLIACVEDGSLWAPSAFTSAYRELLKRRGLAGPNFHALRHSHASHLLKAGVDPKLISSRLGHSRASFTMDTYAHLLPGADQSAAERVNESLVAALERNRKATSAKRVM